MASGKSVYLEDKILDFVLGAVTWTPPATVYIALSTAAFSATATGSSMNEVTGSGYGRVSVSNNTTNWPAAAGAGNLKSNANNLIFPTATADWGTVASFYIVDASSGGNCLYGGDLDTSRMVSSGSAPSFAAGVLKVYES